jgi:hypothetical protein
LNTIKRILGCKTKGGLSVSYGGQANLYRDGSAALPVSFTSSQAATVEELYLVAGGKKFHSAGWKPLAFSGTRQGDHRFNLSEIVAAAGEGALARLYLVAVAGGREYKSPPFSLESLIR